MRDHLPGLAQHQFDMARVLVHGGGEFDRPRARLHAVDLDDPALRLGDDLLRHHQHVAVGQRLARPFDRGEDQRRQVVAGFDARNALQRGQRHPGRHRARYPPAAEPGAPVTRMPAPSIL